jgi:two-component system, LuxR family, sensor kinase FixL
MRRTTRDVMLTSRKNCRRPPSPESDPLVSRLALRYILALFAVACLVTVDQAVLQPMLVQLVVSDAVTRLLSPAESDLGEEFRTARGEANHVRRILAHEGPYLVEIERAVRMFEAEARRRVAWLRALGVSAMVAVLGLLAVIGLFVVRPATRRIAAQLHELECRVAERTNELTMANESLRRESDRRLQMRQQLNERAQQIAHLSRVRALGQLASGLAHELNQPLGAIVNYTNVCELHLERSPLDNEALRAAVMRAQRAALRAGEIVRRMRGFARPDAATKSSIDLNLLVREVVELCRPEIQRWNVALTVDYSAEPLEVRVDPIQIQQVLVNLLQNAIQALRESPCKSRRVRLEIVASSGDAMVRISDTGPGFANDVLPQLFRPFYSTKPDGLGLGLAISRSIAQEHSGQLFAVTRPEGGALLTLTLPRNQHHDSPVPVPISADGIPCG